MMTLNFKSHFQNKVVKMMLQECTFQQKKVQCEKISSSFNQTISHAGFTFNKENAVFGAIIFKVSKIHLKKFM